MKRITVSAPLRLFVRGRGEQAPRLFRPGTVYEVPDEVARNSYLARFLKTCEDVRARKRAKRKSAEAPDG